MANAASMKAVVKHLVDGTLEDTLCRVCLGPLGGTAENIFTKICKDDSEYSVADVLELLFHVKLSKAANYRVCSGCFIGSFTAYKFFKNYQSSSQILEFYTGELLKNLDYINSCGDQSVNSICITLEEFVPSTQNFTNYNIINLLYNDYEISHEEFGNPKNKDNHSKDETSDLEDKVGKNDNIVIIVGEDGEPAYYNLNDNNILEPCVKTDNNDKKLEPVRKRRHKRQPMPQVKCSRCDVKHRFLKKLKWHMKTEHNVDLFVCQICKSTTENEFEFYEHLQTHTDVHCCAICNTVFKRRETIIAHLKWHETMSNLSAADQFYVCEVCGAILRSEKEMEEHYDKRHEKKHICHYCGKRYRVQRSLELHLEKHEIIGEKPNNKKTETLNNHSKTTTKSQEGKSQKDKVSCEICGRSFVDERALRWHTMLHTNERPFKCDTCGRAFISASRRNQHALCSHAPPQRRCPLCPALFHLTSMVNSHVKKVHLKTNKRRRQRKHPQQVSWRAEPVPIQDLGLDIQHKVIQLQESGLSESWRYDDDPDESL